MHHLGRPNGFQYSFLLKALTMGVLLATLVVTIPCFYAAEKYQLPVLKGIGGFIFLCGFYIAIFVVREVIYRMEEEGTLLFRKAIILTVNGYILKLCFIPIIGPFIEKVSMRERHKNPFVEDIDEK